MTADVAPLMLCPEPRLTPPGAVHPPRTGQARIGHERQRAHGATCRRRASTAASEAGPANDVSVPTLVPSASTVGLPEVNRTTLIQATIDTLNQGDPARPGLPAAPAAVGT
jgi:hypothetical protein